MPTPYLKIYNHNGFCDNRENFAAPDDVDSEVGSDGVAGRLIMAKATELADGDDLTFQHLFQAFNATDLRGSWTWQPAGGGSDMTGLLDGTKTSGECLHFANALYFLARCPAPWGLGLTATDVPRPKTYKGTDGEGFISEHNGVFLGLGRNVMAAPGYAGQPLYYWANHKTVQYADRWYDICYRTSYASPADMASYHLTGKYGRTDKDEVWDPGDMSTLNLQAEGKTAEKSKRHGRYYYFRRMSQQQQLANAASFEGPITETALEVRRMNSQGLRMAS